MGIDLKYQVSRSPSSLEDPTPSRVVLLQIAIRRAGRPSERPLAANPRLAASRKPYQPRLCTLETNGKSRRTEADPHTVTCPVLFQAKGPLRSTGALWSQLLAEHLH